MSTIENRYRIYCETDNQWEYFWSTDGIEIVTKECPTNLSHEINENSLSEVDVDRRIISSTKQSIVDTNYTNIKTFIYKGIKGTIKLKKFNIILETDAAISDYSLRIVNSNTGSVYGTYDGTIETGIVNRSIDVSLPDVSTILSLEAKITNTLLGVFGTGLTIHQIYSNETK